MWDAQHFVQMVQTAEMRQVEGRRNGTGRAVETLGLKVAKNTGSRLKSMLPLEIKDASENQKTT